ncbi:MAG TPA: dihydroxyacetone kinase, partial [Ornithinibacter sp.]|nr:dihydroxyacetone kinase [Ornithinibacter sp.]
EALARAGVVDAGGAGCVLMLESFHRLVTGQWSPSDDGLLSAGPALQRRDEWHQPPAAVAAGGGTPSGRPDAVAAPVGRTPASLPGHDPLDLAGEQPGGGPSYEVMYLLDDATPEAVEVLRTTLDALGDSLLVVGGPELWNVHVHVDDPGAAVEAGVTAGRPERIRITHLATQVAAREQPVPLAVVACAAGPGIAQLLDAVHATGSRAVVVLPGDRDTLMAAEVAARAAAGEGVDVHVVPARTTVQALAALAVLDPARSVHANVVSMTGAAVSTRHGAVSVATKQALTWAGVCKPGDVLGVVDGDIAFLHTEVEGAAREVLSRLLSAGGELVTLVLGADAEPGLGQRVKGALERDRPELEVVVIDGGQPVYPLLVGVE